MFLIGIGVILIINGPEVQDDVVEKTEKRSVFISYIELSNYLNCKNREDAVAIVKEMVGNVKSIGFNEIILQVRSFADAIYKSNIFPALCFGEYNLLRQVTSD